MRTAHIIAVVVFYHLILITLFVLWYFGYFTPRRECINPVAFPDRVICVPTNKATLLESKDEWMVLRRPECKYYLIDTEHVGKDGQLMSMKYAKEIIGDVVPERKAPIYILIVEI